MNKSVTILKSRFTMQGGAEKYSRCLAHAFLEKGCPVTVLTTDPVNKEFPFEIVSHSLKSKTSVGKIWEFETFCNHYLQTHPTDIVFSLDRNRFQTHLRAGSGVHHSYLQLRKAFEPKWKALRHFINPLHRSLLHIEKIGFEHPQLKVLFTNSELVKQEIISLFDIDPKKITVVHNGVEWKNWEESFNAWEEKKNSKEFRFLFLGNNFERKGLIPLLEALETFRDKNFHLSIVGKDKNLKKFEAFVEKLKLSKNVSFHGEQKDVRPFLQIADCLVIPSFYDPFANVTIEALAMGLFVVSSKSNGGSEILTRNTGAIIEDLQSIQSIKKALEIALDHPKTTTRALQIRQSVKKFDFSSQLDAYLEKCLLPT